MEILWAQYSDLSYYSTVRKRFTSAILVIPSGQQVDFQYCVWASYTTGSLKHIHNLNTTQQINSRAWILTLLVPAYLIYPSPLPNMQSKYTTEYTHTQTHTHTIQHIWQLLHVVSSAQNAKFPKFTWQSHTYYSRYSLLVSLKPQLPDADLFALFNAFFCPCTQCHNANYYIASFICLHICCPIRL